MDAATKRNNQPSPTMKPTIASANMWIAKKALLQVRQKRFVRAAAILHWQRFIGVAASVWVLNSVIGTTQGQIWIRLTYVLIALAYVWMDIHYSVKHLKRRAKWRALWRQRRDTEQG